MLGDSVTLKALLCLLKHGLHEPDLLVVGSDLVFHGVGNSKVLVLAGITNLKGLLLERGHVVESGLDGILDGPSLGGNVIDGCKLQELLVARGGGLAVLGLSIKTVM